MKLLHRKDLFCWSVFNEERNVDFNSVVLSGRPGGNIVFDPMPMSAHDEKHLRDLGGAAWIVITNASHVRDTEKVRAAFGAKVAAPLAERSLISIPVDRWLSPGDELVPGLRAIGFDGSKTPGELAFVLDETILITGDLIRSHRLGKLMLLPDSFLKDPAAAKQSLRRLLDFPKIDSVLVGDGWHLPHHAAAELKRVLEA